MVRTVRPPPIDWHRCDPCPLRGVIGRNQNVSSGLFVSFVRVLNIALDVIGWCARARAWVCMCVTKSAQCVVGVMAALDGEVEKCQNGDRDRDLEN